MAKNKKPVPRASQTKVELIYIGKRIFSEEKGKISYCFLDGEIERHWVKKRYWCEIGRYYEATQENPENVTIADCPEEIEGKKASQELIEKWEIEESIAEAFIARVKRSRQAANLVKRVAVSCHELRRVLNGLPYSSRKLFLDALDTEIFTMRKGK